MTEFFTEIKSLFEQYDAYLLLMLIAGVVSFLATPISGVLSFHFDATDKPAQLRDRNDKTRFRRIHNEVMPNLGGIAIFVGFLIAFAIGRYFGLINFSQSDVLLDNQQLVAFFIGIVILFGMGIWDAAREIPAKTQMLIQIIAALIVIFAGLKIEFIEILGLDPIYFTGWNFEVALGSVTLYFAPLADLITLGWILLVVNAINWVAGIDGLGGGISVIAAVTFMFISVKTGVAVLAAPAIAAILAGAGMGFLPFNLPPAKTYNGTAGDMLQGFILAVLAILVRGKLAASLIILALPLVDALWVLAGRFRKHKKDLKSPVDILKVSDKTHLHHRLLKLGLSTRQVLLMELTIFSLFALLAYYFAGFSQEVLLVILAVVLLLVIFSVIAMLKNKPLKEQDQVIVEEEVEEEQAEVVTETPEERFAY